MKAMREDIIKAVKVLERGGSILYPTDTIWGIGCDATNPKAVENIYNIKRRSTSKSFIILLDQPEKLVNYVEHVPEISWDLINSVDTPLTVIYTGAVNLAKNVIAPDGSIAIRITRDPFCKRLINLFNKPLVSSSANITDRLAPFTFADIHNE